MRTAILICCAALLWGCGRKNASDSPGPQDAQKPLAVITYLTPGIVVAGDSCINVDEPSKSLLENPSGEKNETCSLSPYISNPSCRL